MTTAANRYWKKKEITDVEQSVGVALGKLEQGDLSKTDLKQLYLQSVTDLTSKFPNKKPVYLIHIPFPCLRVYLKLLSHKLIPELEKQLKATILVAAKRQIQNRWIKVHKNLKRPFSRTLTSVYDALLDDLLAPGTILGKRTRVRIDGTRFHRIFLDEKDKEFLEPRLEVIKQVYKLLTTRELEFEFKKDETFFSVKLGKAGKPHKNE
ncbi:hypothetical protein pb186bvf_008310 [Paramecium bursaria]